MTDDVGTAAALRAAARKAKNGARALDAAAADLMRSADEHDAGDFRAALRSVVAAEETVSSLVNHVVDDLVSLRYAVGSLCVPHDGLSPRESARFASFITNHLAYFGPQTAAQLAASFPFEGKETTIVGVGDRLVATGELVRTPDGYALAPASPPSLPAAPPTDAAASSEAEGDLLPPPASEEPSRTTTYQDETT